MTRLLVALAVLVCLPVALLADDPKPAAVEKTLAIQIALANADDHLRLNAPQKAVAELEAQLPNIDGNKQYLAKLRDAYIAELKQHETSATPDAKRIAEIKSRLNGLGRPEPQPAAAAPTAAPAALPLVEATANSNALADARALFKQERFAEAAAKFAAAKSEGASLKPDEVEAWVYCRIKTASDRVNLAGCAPATAANAEQDVADAIRLVPDHAKLREAGNAVLVAARQKSGGRAPTNAAPVAAAPAIDGWDVVETASFRVRHKGNRELADNVAKAAEAKRKDTFERLSGPVSGAWEVKCVIVLHPTAADYAKSTGKPAEGTGHALVKLTDGRAAERRIDLRADDAGVVTNALPREMMHVVLADLFPARPPAKWAEEGLALLAGSSEETRRYVEALPRCAERGELFPVASLLGMESIPAEKVAGFYCESVSLVEFLVKRGGERRFTMFLREIHRYGAASALKRQYSIESPQALEAEWKRTALNATR